ncbi:hypothetical protein DQG23_06875 [Paenibacillus contaminans]|uniref:Uncharacterized protein n=1 Tax=Paenibacillus contaminans TaxID=450362 RepID=A0A329MR36_9BACL|nr:hypothetical protein DQG23_06875 [Paenibacillus contaminans]
MFGLSESYERTACLPQLQLEAWEISEEKYLNEEIPVIRNGIPEFRKTIRTLTDTTEQQEM